jgi:fatty-acyl-CoA synthase
VREGGRPEDHVLWRWLADRALSDPGAVAIEDADRRVTYAQLRELSLGMAELLAQAGAGRGDRVATLTENSSSHVALFFACAASGAALVPLNWRLTPAELAAQLDIASPALFIASPAHEGRAREALAASGQAAELSSLAEMVEMAEMVALAGPLNRGHRVNRGRRAQPRLRRDQPVPVADDDPLLVVFTSGSSGRPKGAVLTHANCFWTNLSLDLALPVCRGEAVLSVLPQFHVGGWNVQPLQALWKGATVFLEESFDPERALFMIERRRIVTMMGVPTTYARMAEAPNFARADLGSLRSVVVGGAPVPAGLVEVWQRRGVGVAQGYGLTEASPNVACLSPEEATAEPGSVGRPYSFVDVELHDPSTGAVVEGPGAGELWVAGPNVFAGYFRDERATEEVLREGWLRTGDLAERDAGGYLRIRGRMKDMFISGGENVYPAEVEAVLSSHPSVAEAAVVGAPDPAWGESGVAFVRTKGELREEELISYCRGRLAGFKVPRRVVVVEELPRLGSGKLDKRRLADMAQAPRSEQAGALR